MIGTSRVRRWCTAGACALTVVFALPEAAEAQSDVWVSATPSQFTPGATITIDASVEPGLDIWAECSPYAGCFPLGGTPFIQINGSNGFYHAVNAQSVQVGDTGPGQSMQATTYTVYAGVIYDVCYGPPGPYPPEDCQSYGQIPESGSAQATVTPIAAPTVDSVSPISGLGGTQTFTLQYSSVLGYANIVEAWALVHGTVTGANSCVIIYVPPSGLIWLWDDAGTGSTSAAIGSGTILQNSQCRVLTGGASAAGNGNTLTVTIPVAFKAAYTGPKSVFMNAKGAGGLYADWQDRGDWLIPAHNITADYASPTSGGGSSQTFTLGYTSNYGAGDLYEGMVWFSPTIAPNGAQSCLVRYMPSTHTLSLVNDAATGWTEGAVGTGPVLQNSQCAVNTTTAGASSSGNTWTVNVPITFASGFDGLKNIYMSASSNAGPATGWLDRGDWDPLCTFDVTPQSETVPATAGSINVSVTTTSVCAWTAPSSSAFLSLSGGGGTTGSGAVTYAYGSHSGEPRSTQVTVAGNPVSVTQGGDTPAASEFVVFYHTDALGSIRVLTDANGQIYPNAQTRYDYLPFGVLWLEPLHKDRRLFTGQERDAETSLDYFGARHYARATERFTSPDPITLTAAGLFQPSRLNRYTYASNNPTTFIDLYGLQTCHETMLNVCVEGKKPVSWLDLGYFLWRLGIGFGENWSQQVPTIDPNPGPEIGPAPRRRSPQRAPDGKPPCPPLGFSPAPNSERNLVRAPDYWEVQLNMAIPNPYTLTLLGVSGHVNLDRNGKWYAGLGPSVGKSATLFSGSVTGNWIRQSTTPTANELRDFLTASAWSGGAGFGAGTNITLSPSTLREAIGVGYVSPQVGFGYQFSWMIEDEIACRATAG